MEKPDETLLFGQRENEPQKENEVLESPLKRQKNDDEKIVLES